MIFRKKKFFLKIYLYYFLIYNYEIETTKIKNAKIAMYHIKIKYFGFDFS